LPTSLHSASLCKRRISSCGGPTPTIVSCSISSWILLSATVSCGGCAPCPLPLALALSDQLRARTPVPSLFALGQMVPRSEVPIEPRTFALCNLLCIMRRYCKTSDRNPQLLSVQVTLTPGLYPGPDFCQNLLPIFSHVSTVLTDETFYIP